MCLSITFCVVETDLVDLSERLYISGHETKFREGNSPRRNQVALDRDPRAA